MQEISKGKEWATHDPLGLGGLLSDAYRLVQIVDMGNSIYKYLLRDTMEDSGMGLAFYSKTNHLKVPADYRLAFRELGLAIGLKAIGRMEDFVNGHPDSFVPLNQWALRIESLKEYEKLIGVIEKFWMMPENQQSESWKEHENINMVMMGTNLAPDGFLQV